MVPTLEIVPHPTGPWLVRAGAAQYAVPGTIAGALVPLAGKRPAETEIKKCLEGVAPPAVTGPWVDLLGRLVAGVEPRRSGRTIRFRLPILPTRLVGPLAGSLCSFTGNVGLAALFLGGCAGYLAVLAGTGPIGFAPDLDNVITGLGLFLLSALWHELGHAAALARSGYPPGGIGAGLLFVIPVLYADVTAVGALPRSSRLRVDAAGVVFQIFAGGVMAVLATLPGCPATLAAALTLAGFSALLAVVWSLLPFIRSDGYWLLCDLLGLDGLEQSPRGQVSRALGIFLVVYQLTNAGFLLLVGIYFPWRMIRLVLLLGDRTGLVSDPVTANWLAAGLALVLLAVMGVALARRIGTLVGAAFLGFKRLTIPR